MYLIKYEVIMNDEELHGDGKVEIVKGERFVGEVRCKTKRNKIVHPKIALKIWGSVPAAKRNLPNVKTLKAIAQRL